jgi:hypothetical protein
MIFLALSRIILLSNTLRRAALCTVISHSWVQRRHELVYFVLMNVNIELIISGMYFRWEKELSNKETGFMQIMENVRLHQLF